MVFSGRGALVWKAVSPTGLGKLILISEIAAVGQPKASLSDFARRDSPQRSVNIQQVVRNEHTFSQGMFFFFPLTLATGSKSHANAVDVRYE